VWTVLAVALGTALAVQPLAAQTAVVRPRSNTVPIELLSHPLREKPRRMLQKAFEAMNTGNHEAAIPQLQEVLAKYPDAAYYAYSLLGFAYLKTNQFELSVDSFEKALRIVPHDAFNHYDLGVSLISAGIYDRGEEEVRRVWNSIRTTTLRRHCCVPCRKSSKPRDERGCASHGS
jgi:Tfp pilus assembly protein PilF